MYMDYIDVLTGRTLEAAPGGGVYDVLVASGQAPGLPLPPGDGRWMAAPMQQAKAPVTADLPPVLAVKPAAPVTPEKAGGSPAEEES